MSTKNVLAALLLCYRSFALVMILALSACVSQGSHLPATQELPPEFERPNIILVLFEDMSPRVGVYGDPLAKTPNFDRIASESVMYTNSFTTSGVCAPSRAALISGRYQQSIGAQHMRTMGSPGFPAGGPQDYLAVPPPEVKAFPELLRVAGYYTSNDAKTDYQFGEPFTIWDWSAAGADWSKREANQPFFHMKSIMVSHESYIWPVDMDPQTPMETAIVTRNAREFANRPPHTDPAQVLVPPYLPDTAEVRRDIATHYDNIASADDVLGELYTRLQSEGLLENSILIVSTDHGDGLPRMKRSLYDSGLRVPMVVRYPDVWGAGTVNHELISFVDIAPTVLSWAGATKPEWMQGRDFSGADRSSARDFVFAAQDRMDNEPNWRRAVSDGRFKYIRNLLPGDPFFEPLPFRDAQPTMKALWAGREAGTLAPAANRLFEASPEDEFYDTSIDPHEVQNLAGSAWHLSKQAELEAALDAWLQRAGDLSEISEAEMVALMWPGGVQPVTDAPQAHLAGNADNRVITLVSSTPGASIGYQVGEETVHWKLYTQPVMLPAGTPLRARAIRYGYAESDEVRVE